MKLQTLKKMSKVKREFLFDKLYEKAVCQYLNKTDFSMYDWLSEEDLITAERINYLNGESDKNPDEK